MAGTKNCKACAAKRAEGTYYSSRYISPRVEANVKHFLAVFPQQDGTARWWTACGIEVTSRFNPETGKLERVNS